MPILGPILDIVASFLGFTRKRQELVNSPEMQANKQAATDAELKAEAAKVIADKDAAAAAKAISE